ncbi:hypothetical protein [Mesonia aquimarina]|uniref:hypothetical protein n=1 Tax=Mesonia aquimarina TaxID=1504967 RepID=UPI0013CEBC7F|nr:hypothetical protein [Mesonia aquimarina]
MYKAVIASYPYFFGSLGAFLLYSGYTGGGWFLIAFSILWACIGLGLDKNKDSE